MPNNNTILANAPTRVRALTRDEHRIQLFDYETGENHLDPNGAPHSVIHFYKYSRSVGRPKEENTTAVIRWPMPLSYSEPSSVTLENYDFGLLGNAMNLPDLGKVKEGVFDVDTYKAIASAIGRGVTGIPGITMEGLQNSIERVLALSPIARDTGFGRLSQLDKGAVVNPHTAILFNGVPMRRFTLNWRFSPRSEAMGLQLQRSINTIRKRIYPKLSDTRFSFEYPDLCRVDLKGTTMPGIRKSFVENMTVTNSSGGSIELYRDGRPVDYDITMSFLETEIIHRDIANAEAEAEE